MAKSYMTSINEKVKAIEAEENDKLSVQEIMMWFKCGKKHKQTHLNKRVQ
jgi:hypothetical protein